jgi:hypothetical protein
MNMSNQAFLTARPLRLLLLVALGSSVATSALAQRVIKRSDRSDLIEEVETLLATHQTRDYGAFSEWKYPFAFPVEVIVEAPVEEPEVVVVEEVPEVVTHEEVLDAVAGNLRVSGVMEMNGVPVMIVGRKNIPEGQPLRLPYKGETYIIVVESVSDEAYTLRLDETVKTVRLKKDVSAHIQRVPAAQ